MRAFRGDCLQLFYSESLFNFNHLLQCIGGASQDNLFINMQADQKLYPTPTLTVCVRILASSFISSS